jgi:disulfide bond formation protein DsbB
LLLFVMFCVLYNILPMIMKCLKFDTPRLLLLLAAGSLGAAFGIEKLFHVVPCPLCIYQRWIHVGVICCSLGCIMLSTKKSYACFRFLYGMLLLSGLALSTYHFSIEHKWLPELEVCKESGSEITRNSPPRRIDAGDIIDALSGKYSVQQEVPPKPSCANPTLLLGLSLTTWNGLILLLMWLIVYL